MDTKRIVQRSLIVGSSTLFATLAACNHGDCEDVRQQDTNDVQAGEESLVGVECDPERELASCDLNGTNTVYCYGSPQDLDKNAVWIEDAQSSYEPFCENGTLREPMDCGGIGYTGITDQRHRTHTCTHRLRGVS